MDKQKLIELGLSGLQDAESNQRLLNCKHCEDCVNCEACESCVNCEDCVSCKACVSCEACESCEDCISCRDQTEKKYMVQNIQFSESEYRDFISRQKCFT